MKRERHTFYTGRLTDGSDREEHVDYVWTVRYAGQDYEVGRVTDPASDVLTVVDDTVVLSQGEVTRAKARRVDQKVDVGDTVDMSLAPPTSQEIADVLAVGDVAALVDKTRIIAAMEDIP